MPKTHRRRRSAKKRKQNRLNLAAALVLLCSLFIIYVGVDHFFMEPQVADTDSGGSVTTSATNSSDETVVPVADGSCAKVYFINVGQGDCELIVADDGTTMLIDGGESEYGDTVVAYLGELGITRLDYVVGTHPHSDHIGGLRKVISSDIEIGEVIMPEIPDDYVPTTNSYEKLLTAIEKKGCHLYAAEDETIAFGSGTLRIIVPDYSEDELNNYSIVIRFDFGSSSFLFTGDIEKLIETQLVESGIDLDVDVLKVAHHGSSTSSSYAFLDAVTPEYCVIECGDNSYNHPNSDVVDRLELYTENIYRTDIDGTVIFSCTGSGFSIETESGG
ncbi:MAG: MBL fold metallo-hydrolase [Oscillospiraceae bacterium]|nr:MBL fold metallo-hydrolase [Oscillospiraceae bacterium]